MNDLNDSERQTHSPETLNELNSQELLQRIHAAETAIFLRLRGMRISSIDLVEGQAIQDALDGLVRLTKETLEFADFASRSYSRRRQGLGLGQTDNARTSNSTSRCFPKFLQCPYLHQISRYCFFRSARISSKSACLLAT
jgi:hypothetical protein